MISWPNTLPDPTSSYKISTKSNLLRTKMESGRIRQRRRTTSQRYQLSVSWEFNDEEFKLFQSFLLHSINSGASWFEMNLYSGGGRVLHKVRIIGGDYDSTYLDVLNWKVTVKLDVEELNLYDQYDTFYQMYSMSLVDFSTQVNSHINNYFTESWNE